MWEDDSATAKGSMLNSSSPVMLVSDGFILPGHDDGGLYAVVNPRSSAAQVYRITQHKPGWFYHRAVHVHLPGGRQGILTARLLLTRLLSYLLTYFCNRSVAERTVLFFNQSLNQHTSSHFSLIFNTHTYSLMLLWWWRLVQGDEAHLGQGTR